MTNYAVVAGHNDIITGALGHGFKEHIVARQVKDKVIYFFELLGEKAYDCTDEVGKTKQQVWLNAANNCNKKIGKDGYIIALHLNAGGGTGTEVFDYKGKQKTKCQAVAERLAEDFSWSTRGEKGWKDGSWIGLIKKAQAPVIYIELCFIDNKSDMTKLMKDLDKAAIGIVEAITGKKVPIEKKNLDVKEYHTVIKGDLVSKIAMEYGSTIKEIKTWNKLDSKYTIKVGQKLRVK